MKRSAYLTALLWAALLPVARAQGPTPHPTSLPIPADTKDPFGQRLGWTPDQIKASVEATPGWQYSHYSKDPDGPDTMLAYDTKSGMRLLYTFREGKAMSCMLLVPLADGLAADVKRTYLDENAPYVHQISPHWYATPYAKVRVDTAAATARRGPALTVTFLPPKK